MNNEWMNIAICTCGHVHSQHLGMERVHGEGIVLTHPCRVPDCSCAEFESRGSSSDLVASTEAVNNPVHYGGADDPFEHIKVAEALGWGYHIGNCTKYLWRLGKKDPTKVLEDLRKARWYLDRYITLLEKS